MGKNKNQKWVKPRHKVIKTILYPFIKAYVKLKCGVKIERFKGKGQYLIIANHQTAYDQFFVDLLFKNTVYYLSSEDVLSAGLISKVLRFLFNPIPIKKQTQDASAVMTCMRVAKEGGSIGIFPEGNRTYSGKTEYINPSIAKLAKKLNLPIAFVRIEGGYGIQPRWSDVFRKGKSRAYISRVMQVEEVKSYSVDELYDIIKKELFVDENVLDNKYYHKKSAEYLERAIYVCPTCGISKFESKKDVIECKKCSKKVRCLPNKQLEGVNYEFPFKFIGEWYEYQTEFISKTDISVFENSPAHIDEQVSIYDVVFCKKKQLFKKDISMFAYADRFEFDKGERKIELPFEKVSAVTVLGRNKLNIYYENNKKAYQIKGTKRFNALKYVHFYFHYKNVKGGRLNEQFLGL